MRVLHYIPGIDRKSGGVGSYIQQLSRGLGKCVELHIVSHRSDDELPICNSEIHYVPSFTVSTWGSAFRKEWRNCLLKINPDVVQVNGCWMPSTAYAVILAKQEGYKVVLCPHGMLEPWDVKKNYWTKKLPALLLYQKKAIKDADCILATSEMERCNLLNLGYNNKLSVIPNGIDINDISIKSTWKIRKRILFLALLRKNKGVDILIKSVAKLRNELEGYKVIIAGTTGNGEKSYVSHLHRLVEQFQLNAIIEFTGGIYREDKWRCYQDSDFFVLPTINENFGIVIAESLLSGTPVITCKGAPWPHLVTNRCGWWVNRDVDSVAHAISEAICLNQEQLEVMGRNGRKLVEEYYSLETIALKMKTLYEWVWGIGDKPEFVYE